MRSRNEAMPSLVCRDPRETSVKRFQSEGSRSPGWRPQARKCLERRAIARRFARDEAWSEPGNPQGRGFPGSLDVVKRYAAPLREKCRERHSAKLKRGTSLTCVPALRYPNLTKVDVVAYERETEPSLMLYAQELAKLVHAQFLARY